MKVKKNKCFIITGSIHSGTSLVAKIINDKYLKLIKPLQFNAETPYMGYENKLFHTIVREMLSLCDVACPLTKCINHKNIPSPQMLNKKMLELQKFTIPIVFKAPYVCFTLGSIKRDIDCYVVVTNRNVNDNIKSIMNRENLSESDAKSLIDKFKTHLAYNLEGVKYINVSFEKLLKKDEKEIKKLEKFVEEFKQK